MHKNILFIAFCMFLFSSCMYPVEYFPAAIIPEGDVFVVDDFEDGNLANKYGTWELVTSYSGATAPVSITPATAAGCGNYSLFFSLDSSPHIFGLNSGFVPDVRYSGFPKYVYDVSSFRYLKFSAAMTVSGSPSVLYCNVWIDGKGSPLVGYQFMGGFGPVMQEYSIDLTTLDGGDDYTLQDVLCYTTEIRFHFVISNPTGLAVRFIVDNIRFEK